MADVYLLIHFCVVEVLGPLVFCLMHALQSAKMYMLQFFFIVFCVLVKGGFSMKKENQYRVIFFIYCHVSEPLTASLWTCLGFATIE